jgi:cytochrome P450
MRAMRRDLIGFCAGLKHDYGDVVRFRLGPVSFLLLSHPDQIHEALVLKARSFRKPSRVRNVFGRFQGDGLFVSDGEQWARQRRLLQSAFQPSRLRTYSATITECAATMIDRWGQHAEVDFQAEMMRLALVVVTRALFSTSSDDVADRLAEAVAAINRWSIRELTGVFCTPRWLPLLGQSEIRRAISLVNSVMERMIDQRIRSPGMHDDLLDRLLAAGEPESDVRRLTRRQIRDELVTLLFAGHDTSGVAMTWTGWLLAVRGDIQKRLSDEVRTVVGTRMPDVDDLPRLRGVEMAFKEAMRLFPPVYFFSREVASTVEIGGCTMQPGGQVFLCPYLTQRDPRWFPDPTRFDPWRFTPENEQRRPACAWFPFGAGPRACIGRGFSLMEGTLIFATLLQRCRLEPVPGQGEPAVECQLSLHPRGGTRLSVTNISEIHGLV